MTLALLARSSVAGMRGSGFWLIVLANWVAAVARRCAARRRRPHDKTLPRVIDTRDPAAVRRLRVLSVGGRGARLRRAHRAVAGAELDRRRGSSARCGCCGRISSRPSFSACCQAMSSAAAPGFLVAVRRPSLHFPRTRTAADRQFRLGAADRRRRADHGDVVRLRLAVESRGRRRHHVFPDAGEHARGP